MVFFFSNPLSCKTVCLFYTRIHKVTCMYMQNVHAKYETKQKKKRKRTRLQFYKNYSTEQSLLFVVGEDDAGTYLHYILPAHPDHNCEKDALVRRQRGPEGSYPSLSGRWGDQVDWTQILLTDYFTKFPPCWANKAVHLLSFTASALCFQRNPFFWRS